MANQSLSMDVPADDLSDLTEVQRPLPDPIDLSEARPGETVRMPGAAARRELVRGAAMPSHAGRTRLPTRHEAARRMRKGVVLELVH